jgi:Spy/CpxP family protein refolding chaperone
MFHAKLMAGALAAVVGAGAVGAHVATKCEHGPWADRPLGQLISGHVGRWMVLRSELNLTDAQKDKIKETLKAKKPEIAKVAKGVWDKRTVLANAVLADQPDEQAIRRAADDLGKAIGDAAVFASKVVGEVRPVLTTEQRDKIQKCRSECQDATTKFFEKATKAE